MVAPAGLPPLRTRRRRNDWTAARSLARKIRDAGKPIPTERPAELAPVVTPEQWAALILHLEGAPLRDIAEACGVPRATMSRVCWHAIRRYYELLAWRNGAYEAFKGPPMNWETPAWLAGRSR